MGLKICLKHLWDFLKEIILGKLLLKFEKQVIY